MQSTPSESIGDESPSIQDLGSKYWKVETSNERWNWLEFKSMMLSDMPKWSIKSSGFTQDFEAKLPQLPRRKTPEQAEYNCLTLETAALCLLRHFRPFPLQSSISQFVQSRSITLAFRSKLGRLWKSPEYLQIHYVINFRRMEQL